MPGQEQVNVLLKNGDFCRACLVTPVFDLLLSLPYTIFRILNMDANRIDAYDTQSDFLKTISHSTRLAILDILRDGEQCVCHIQAVLNLRQAYISQQLTILKQAGLLEARRDGLNLYYRVVKPEVFKVLETLSHVTGTSPLPPKHGQPNANCPCPKCNS
jgi:DNA-binding transcriptional ArsR family regulator